MTNCECCTKMTGSNGTYECEKGLLISVKGHVRRFLKYPGNKLMGESYKVWLNQDGCPEIDSADEYEGQPDPCVSCIGICGLLDCPHGIKL